MFSKLFEFGADVAAAVEVKAEGQAIHAGGREMPKALHRVQTMIPFTPEGTVGEVSRKMSLTKETAEQIQTDSLVSGKEAKKLDDSVEAMESTVQVIRDIAQRVNILALNAAIEAARTGDAGKGFAVVAGEGKNLSDQTTRGAQQIADEVEPVQAISGGLTEAIERTLAGVSRVNRYVVGVATAMEEQTIVTEEIPKYSNDLPMLCG